MKILENFTTSVIVKILWKQHHEKIDPCKKCRKKCSCGFVFQHLAKLVKFSGIKSAYKKDDNINFGKTNFNAKDAKNYEQKRFNWCAQRRFTQQLLTEK